MVKKLDNTKNYIIVIVYWKDHTSDGGFGGVNIILKKCITDIWELDFVPSIYNKN